MSLTAPCLIGYADESDLSLSLSHQMLEFSASKELKAKSGELMDNTDTEFSDISFEELLAQEKKDSFWYAQFCRIAVSFCFFSFLGSAYITTSSISCSGKENQDLAQADDDICFANCTHEFQFGSMYIQYPSHAL